MMVLFKYLPIQYATALVERGEVLFRSLSYFRQQEHAARGDEVEGVHVDDPDKAVTLQNLTTGLSVSGAFRFLNSIDQDHVFAYCCSCRLTAELLQAFQADACVKILDPELFFLRCSRAAKRHIPIEAPGVIHGPLEYFDPAKPATMSVKDPRSVPFFKHQAFASQFEYRGVFARRGGFKLLQRIVRPEFTFADEIAASRPSERLLRLGSLSGIVELIDLADIPSLTHDPEEGAGCQAAV